MTMPYNFLTVDLLEDILLALQLNRPIQPAIASLNATTLPAIIQYKCLAWTLNIDLPPLPQEIVDSDIGKAFCSIESLLQSGQELRPTHIPTIDSRSVEFTALTAKADLETQSWQLFEARFNRSAQQSGFSHSIADLLQGALYEMAENALLHSNTRSPVTVGYRALDGFAQFCVADTGIGILASLCSSPDYAWLQRHNKAIRKALQDGVSRFGTQRGGMGFREVFKAVASQWGLLRFRSGEGCIVIDGTDCTADKGSELFLPFLPGFQVTISCRVTESQLSQPIM